MGAIDPIAAVAVPALLPTAKPPVDSVIRALSSGEQVLLTRLLTEPADFVDHPDFARRDIETRLFGGPAKFSDRGDIAAECADQLSHSMKSGDRLPTLSATEEQHLFMCYNYARRQIAQILRKEAGKTLSAAATKQLLGWGRRALSTRSSIVRINIPLVLAMAKRTRISNIDFNEMISEGNMALLRSVEKFDCSRGFKFSTYSCRAILKSFSRVAMRASRYRVQFPTEFDPAMERSDYTEQQRETVERDCVDELKEILMRNLAGLSDVERTVISERFALCEVPAEAAAQPKTLEQVGHIIGVTKERVRQIQNNALRKIRHALEAGYLAA